MLKFHFGDTELYAFLFDSLINLCVHFLAINTHSPYNIKKMYLQGKADPNLFLSFFMFKD